MCGPPYTNAVVPTNVASRSPYIFSSLATANVRHIDEKPRRGRFVWVTTGTVLPCTAGCENGGFVVSEPSEMLLRGLVFCVALGAAARSSQTSKFRSKRRCTNADSSTFSGFRGGGAGTQGRIEWFRFSPDVGTQGKLRALGRLLRVVGEKLVDGAAGVALASDDIVEGGAGAVGEDTLRGCGMALQGAAEALLDERWADADSLLGATSRRCAELLPEEHLSVLQTLLNKNSQGAADVCDALQALSTGLEAQAETLRSDARVVLHDALFDAAIAFRSASRIFATPTVRRGQNGGRASSAARAEANQGLLEIKDMISAAHPDERKALLRSLARQYHPDRNLGREMDVLPAFLYIQRLREQGWR